MRDAAILAHSKVARAVAYGSLPNLRLTNTRCSDCPARATEYDHRDYNEPLKVEPVCHGCNRKRGSAQNRTRMSVIVRFRKPEYKALKKLADKNGVSVGRQLLTLVEVMLNGKA